MIKQLLTVALMTAAAAAAAPAAAQTGDFSWSSTLRAGQTVEVRGVQGTIRAVPSRDGAVRVQAERSARRGDPGSVRIEVVEHAGGVTICAVYPAPRDARQENECRPGGGRSSVRDSDVRVDFTVHVPAGIALEAHTVTGEVRADGLRSDVRATSVNGNVHVDASQAARVSTVNGSVTVRLGSGRIPDGASFSTVNGSVTIEAPAGLDAEFRASTVNGSIESDFPLAVSGRVGPRQVRGTVGRGGPELNVTTVNGSIRLRRI